MNSINRNQPEHNHDDLSGGKAVDKIKELLKAAASCFFCTATTTGDSVASMRRESASCLKYGSRLA